MNKIMKYFKCPKCNSCNIELDIHDIPYNKKHRDTRYHCLKCDHCWDYHKINKE